MKQKLSTSAVRSGIALEQSRRRCARCSAYGGSASASRTPKGAPWRSVKTTLGPVPLTVVAERCTCSRKTTAAEARATRPARSSGRRSSVARSLALARVCRNPCWARQRQDGHGR